MSYLESERKRLVDLRDAFFGDAGQGVFAGKPRDFVLGDTAANLWAGLREDALAYFVRHGIVWWRGQSESPTGHLLSSQVACVNHLYALRQRQDLAAVVLHAIDPEITDAQRVDEGFVEFEFIGREQRLPERAFTRGANCTSVDACMIGVTASGARRAFLIEWKYTESYAGEDLYIPARAKVYDRLIARPDSPFLSVPQGALYRDPFYQMMRQTLLGWLMAQHGDYGCTSFRHVHVIPAANAELHGRITAPALQGATISEAWRNVLREPSHYIATTPQTFLQPISALGDTESLTTYLAERYWAGDRVDAAKP